MEYHIGLLHKMKRDYDKKKQDGFQSLEDKQAGNGLVVLGVWGIGSGVKDSRTIPSIKDLRIIEMHAHADSWKLT